MHKTDLPDLPLKAGEPGFRRLHQLGKHGTENPGAEREGGDGREREREKDGQRGEYTERERVGVKKEGEDDGRREGRKRRQFGRVGRKEEKKEGGRNPRRENTIRARNLIKQMFFWVFYRLI